MTENVRAGKTLDLPEGEAAVLVTFVAIPMIWTSLIVPMIYSNVCLRSLLLTLAAATLAGMGAGVIRELVIGRKGH